MNGTCDFVFFVFLSRIFRVAGWLIGPSSLGSRGKVTLAFLAFLAKGQ